MVVHAGKLAGQNRAVGVVRRFDPPPWPFLLKFAKDTVGVGDLAAVVATDQGTNNLAIGLAAAARCRRLLMAATALIEAEMPDVVGVALRPLLEVWLVGQYALFGGPEALERLLQQRNDQIRQLLRILGEPADGVGEAKKLPVEQLAQKVTRLHEDNAIDNAAFARFAYNTIYRWDSYRNVHGGLGSVTGHIDESAAERRILPERPERDDATRHVFLIGIAIAVSAAQTAAIRAGLPHSRLDELADLILKLDPRRTEPAE